MQKAEGAWMWDEDGNKYIDLINSWGPMILGHAHPEIIAAATQAFQYSSSFGTPTAMEVVMAEIITQAIPSVEKVRMVNSGTEATMSAIRLARGYTNREKIIKFEGCYHGHGDSFLISAGSGALTFGVSDSQGVTKGVAEDTLTAVYNNLESVRSLFAANPGAISCVIVEPVAGNMGCILPEAGFLEGLREICSQEGALLIFDEVMTGFRLALGGAQERLGVQPDLTCLGKIIGGGMPVGAYGGSTEIMDYVSPAGPIYQAGTLSGNPVAMHAGHTMLRLLRDNPEVYTQIDAATEAIDRGLTEVCREKGIPFHINRLGSMMTLFFREGPVRNLDEAKAADGARFGAFFKAMLSRGVYLPPSPFEAFFISSKIGEKEIAHIIQAARESLEEILG